LLILIEVWVLSKVVDQIQPKSNYTAIDIAYNSRDLLNPNKINDDCDYNIAFKENKKQYCYHKLILKYKAPQLFKDLNKDTKLNVSILYTIQYKYIIDFIFREADRICIDKSSQLHNDC
jgi:hypothetical protein